MVEGKKGGEANNKEAWVLNEEPVIIYFADRVKSGTVENWLPIYYQRATRGEGGESQEYYRALWRDLVNFIAT